MKLKSLFTAALASVSAAAAASPADWGAADTVACYNVGPGIEYTKIIYHDVPLIMWYTTIDLTNPYNKVENMMSRNQIPDVNRQDVMTFYRENSRPGHQVKVAWNHDFFSYEDGICIGQNISNGQITCLLTGRSMLAITEDKKAEVFKATFDARVITEDGTSVKIDVYNSGACGVSGDCLFFNNLNALTLTEDGTYIKVRPLAEWKVNGENIPCEVLAVSTEPLQTSETDCVVFLRGGKRNALDGHVAVGQRVQVQQTFSDVPWGIAPQNIVNAFHGYPSIAHDGVLHDGEYNYFENGREYEKSAHVMAGLSKDKTKLYMCLNEMSVQSQPIDCVDMATWMLERGAWDIVNFDSGGSAAIVVNAEMLNLPGRGAVRPVANAMLAVSLAPEDNTATYLGFSKKRISPSTISLSPLKVMSYNQYGDIVEEGVEGCTFTVVPESLGTVDEDGVFHSSSVGGAGKIIAEKDGLRGELELLTRTAGDIHPAYPSLLLDSSRSYIIPILGTVSGASYSLDPGAFEWSVQNPEVVSVADGMLKGLANGETTVTGRFEDIELNIGVTVEIGKGKLPVYDFSKLPGDGNLELSGLKNFSMQPTLPDGWTDGTAFKTDASGRLRKLALQLPKQLYGVPDGVGLRIGNQDNAISRYTLAYRDNLGGRYQYDTEVAQGDNVYYFDFADAEGTAFDIPQYPIQLEALTLYFNSVSGASFALGGFDAVYPLGGSGVAEVQAADALSVHCDGERLVAGFDAVSEGSAEVCVYAADGAKVLSEKIAVSAGHNEYACNTLWLGDGIYVFTVNVGGKHTAKKFIKR